MVSWVPQILVPPLLALAFLRSWPRAWVMAMAPTTFLADLDYIGKVGHRVYTHTLLIPALVLGGLAWAWRAQVRKPGAAGLRFWEYARRPGLPLAALLLAYYLAAHALMDVFTGGVVLFWPLSNLDFDYDVRIDINLQTGQVLPTAQAYVQQGPNPLDPAYPWLTNEHAAMLAVALAVVVMAAIRAVVRRRQARPAHESPEPSTKGK